jgi:hypothetical protein
LALTKKESDIESQPRARLYQPISVIDLEGGSVFHQMIGKAPSNLTVIWDKQTISGAAEIKNKYEEVMV